MLSSITLKFSAASRSQTMLDISKPKAKVVRRKAGHREIVMPLVEKQKLLEFVGLCPYSLRPLFNVAGNAHKRRLVINQLTGQNVEGRLEILFPKQVPIAKDSIHLKFSTKTFDYKKFRDEIECILRSTGRRFSPRTIRQVAQELCLRADRTSLDHVLPQAWINNNDVLCKHVGQNLLTTSTDENQKRGDLPILECGENVIADHNIDIRPIALSWFLSNKLNRILAGSNSFEVVKPFVDLVSRFTSEKDESKRQTAELAKVVTVIEQEGPSPNFYLKKPMAIHPVNNITHFFTRCFSAGKALWQREELLELARRARSNSPEFSQAITEAVSKSKLS